MFNYIDDLSFKVKNLYNDALFMLRQCFFNLDPIASILDVHNEGVLPVQRDNINYFYQQYLKVAEANPIINDNESRNFKEDYEIIHSIYAQLAQTTVAQAAEDMINFKEKYDKFIREETEKQRKNPNYKIETKKIKHSDGTTEEIIKGSPNVPNYKKDKYNKLERCSIVLNQFKGQKYCYEIYSKIKGIQKRNPTNEELDSLIFEYSSAVKKYKAYNLNQFKLLRVPSNIRITPILLTEEFKDKKIQQIRIRPVSKFKYAVEFIYRETISRHKFKPNQFTKSTGTKITGLASIDIGVDNFATITFISEQPIAPVIIDGKGLKQYISTTNTEKENYRSKIDIDQASKEKGERNYKTKRSDLISNAYNNTTDDFYHKTSRFIINTLKKNNINYLVVGYNRNNWKQGSKMSKETNRVFCKIAFKKLIDLLRYKCKIEGIEFHTNNEIFTSGTSFFDEEAPEKSCYNIERRKYTKYFFTNKGIQLLADINASLQIAVKHQLTCKKYNNPLGQFLEIKYSNPALSHCFKLEQLTNPTIVKLDTFASRSDEQYLNYHTEKNKKHTKCKTVQNIEMYKNNSNTKNTTKLKQYYTLDQERIEQKKLSRHNKNLRKLAIKKLDAELVSNRLSFQKIGY